MSYLNEEIERIKKEREKLEKEYLNFIEPKIEESKRKNLEEVKKLYQEIEKEIIKENSFFQTLLQKNQQRRKSFLLKQQVLYKTNFL
jgi:hypothetical protein